MNRDISVGIVSRQRPWLPGVRIPAKEETFILVERPYRFWGPLSLPLIGYRWFFPGCKAAGFWSQPRSQPSAQAKNEWSYAATRSIFLYLYILI